MADRVRELLKKGFIVCPCCGRQAHKQGQGCFACGADEEEIARAEPGPWGEWGD